MSVYRRRIFAVLAKVEATEGTDATPVAGDAIETANIPTLTLQRANPAKREGVQHNGMGKVGRGKPTGRTGSITLQLQLRGKGSAYTAVGDYVECEPIMLAAGFVKSFTAGKVTFTTSDAPANFKTLTLYLYGGNGKLYKMIGAVVRSWKISYAPGDFVTLEAQIEGRVTSGVSDATIVPTYSQVTPPVWSDATVTLGALTTASADPLVPRKLDVECTNEVATRPWAGADAHKGHAITDRAIRLTMEMEAMALATLDVFAMAGQPGDSTATDTKGNTSAPGGAGNTIGVEWGIWSFEEPEDIDLGGFAGYRIAGDLVARSIAAGPAVGREFALSIS